MRIALVFPPYKHKIFSENLNVVDEEFCLGPPIILAYVAAILERAGHKVILLDARVLNLSKEEALKRIRQFRPDFLGFRAETYHFHDALEWISYLKEQLKVPVMTGGPNLSLYPEETLYHKEIDYGIAGDALESLPKLVAALENGYNIEHIQGILYKKDSRIMANPPQQSYVNFDSYPFPARHLLPNDRYYSFISQRKNFTIMLTSMGCPFRCSFCAIPSNNMYRERSPENVVDEIEQCYKQFNVREIDFFDAVLFLNKPRMMEIFRLMRRRNLKVEWSCRSRVDVVDEEILQEAAEAGCRQIYYGIESADISILNAINKRTDIDQIKQAIRWSKSYAIRPMGFFMIGNPGETVKTVQQSLELAKDLGLDFVQVCRTIAKPGADFDKVMIKKTGRDYWREYVKGKSLEQRLPAPWVDLKEEEMENLTKLFYLRFYLRPSVIIKRLLALRSFSEFVRYVSVAIKMIFYRSEL